MGVPVKVLIYSDFNLATEIKKYFSSYSDVTVEGCASQAKEALKLIAEKAPDVVVIIHNKEELEDAYYLSDELKKSNIKYISVTDDSSEGFKWLQRGAMAIVTKGKLLSNEDMDMFLNRLFVKCKNYRLTITSEERVLKNTFNTPIKTIISMGSSTGGTEVVLHILKEMPQDAPPVLIVQHMPAVFTKLYAERMNGVCKMTVWEAKDGDKLVNGLALVAPGSYQMRVVKKSDGFYVECSDGSPKEAFNPSANVLFESIAKLPEVEKIGIILTGMGSDGATGLLSMKKAGAFTIGQDKESCVVYGMPKEAYDIGAVDKQADFHDIPSIILSML